MPVDFLAIGHITNDCPPDQAGGCRLGGTVSYAAVTALRLGRTPGILTRAALPGWEPGKTQLVDGRGGAPILEPLSGVWLHVLPSPGSTTYTNIYRDGIRRQVVAAVAEPIPAGQLPPEWADSPLVLLGPVAHELPETWAGAFPRGIVGLTPQGFMRDWDATGQVKPVRWGRTLQPVGAAAFLQRADAVILSREDTGGDHHYLAELAQQTRLLVVTDGRHGATVYRDAVPLRFPARPAREVDPTGAGDVFAAAFLIRLAETGDPARSARFANAAASFSVEGTGMSAIPFRSQVDGWLDGRE